MMFAKTRTINRQYVGKDIQNSMDVPDLIAIQTSSYESFLQAEKLKRGEPLANQGLQEVFTSTFPIVSPDGSMSLEFEYYELDYANIKYSSHSFTSRVSLVSILANSVKNFFSPYN